MTQDKINKADFEYFDKKLEELKNYCANIDNLNELKGTAFGYIENFGLFSNRLKSLLQSDNEGVEVTVYDEFKGVKYGTCNGRSKVKCGSDQKEGTEVCEICGTKLIWPDNQKKGEA